MMAQLITSMWGSGDNVGRSANVFKDEDGYFVECSINGAPVKQIDVKEHSINYAEDAADNWVWGLIKE